MKLLFASLTLFTAVTASSPGGGGYYRGGYPPNQYDPHFQSYGAQQQSNPHVQQTHVQQQQLHVAPTQESSEKNAQESLELPSPWQEHIDPSSGRPYYYNPESGVTQWERPEGEKTEDVAASDQTDVQPGSADVSVESNGTAITGDMDPFSSAFALGDASAGKENSVEEVTAQEPDRSIQEGQNRAFGLGAYGMNDPSQGYAAQSYGNQGMQNEQNWQQSQPRQDGQTHNWGEQQMPQEPKSEESGKHDQTTAQNEAPSNRGWNNQEGQSQPMGQEWGQQQQQPRQPEKQGEPEKKHEHSGTHGSMQHRVQMHPQQGQHSGWRLPPGEQQAPSGNQQQNIPGQPGTQQQPGSPSGWHAQQPLQSHEQPPQSHEQPPQSQRPPQWHPGQQPQQGHQEPPPGYPLRPGYGMPPPNMQQRHPMQYQQHMPSQRGPPGYGYPPQQYPYGPPGMGGPNMMGNAPGTGQLVTQRTEELSSAVREKWGQALAGLGSFGNRTKELAENAKNQIGESASSAGRAIGETSTGEFFGIFAHTALAIFLLKELYFIVRHLGQIKSGC